MSKTPEWLEIVELRPDNFERLVEKTPHTLAQLKRMYGAANAVNQVHMFAFADTSLLARRGVLVFDPQIALMEDVVVDEMKELFIRSWTREPDVVDGGSV